MTKTVFKWVGMELPHLSFVKKISELIHLNYPEDEAIVKERLSLYPKGCFVLMADNLCVGYIISHPICAGIFPKLNSLIIKNPLLSETYYLHDIALLPNYQNQGLAKLGLKALFNHAKNNGFKEIYLIAVSGTQDFWKQQGFIVKAGEKYKDILQTYDEDAILMASKIQQK